MQRDWNYERYRTRDRLLEYDPHIMPLCPHSAGLAMIYPWENNNLTMLAHQLYLFAANSGYSGTENEFINNFGTYFTNMQIVFSTLEDFPEEGNQEKLYFDIDTKILYHWNEDEYEPINAMLIVDTILNGGDATNI